MYLDSMNATTRSKCVVLSVGVAAAAAWAFGFDVLHFAVYQMLGAPPKPTQLLWAALLLQSFLMGALPGAIVGYFAHPRSYWVALSYMVVVAIFVVGANLLLAGLHSIPVLATSYGMWLLLAGALVGCLIVTYGRSDA
jgi:hypothetical protein